MIRTIDFLIVSNTDQGTCWRPCLQHNHSDFQHNYAYHQVEILCEVILIFFLF